MLHIKWGRETLDKSHWMVCVLFFLRHPRQIYRLYQVQSNSNLLPIHSNKWITARECSTSRRRKCIIANTSRNGNGNGDGNCKLPVSITINLHIYVDNKITHFPSIARLSLSRSHTEKPIETDYTDCLRMQQPQ